MIIKFLGLALDLCEMACLGMFVLIILFRRARARRISLGKESALRYF